MKIATAVFLYLTLTSSSMAGEEQPDVRDNIVPEIRSAFSGLAEAAKAMDHKQYFAFFDQEAFTSLNADGSVFHSFEAFQDHFLTGVSHLSRYESLSFTNVKIDVIDAQTAILVNEYEAAVELSSGEKIIARGAGTQVWSKRSGTWKLVNISSNNKPQT